MVKLKHRIVVPEVPTSELVQQCTSGCLCSHQRTRHASKNQTLSKNSTFSTENVSLEV